MIVLGKQINIKSIARALIVVLASLWFIPISCTSLLFGLSEEPFMVEMGGPVTDNFNNKDFTIVAVSSGEDKDFIAIPYSDIKTSHSLNFLMPKLEGEKIGKPFKWGEWGGIHPMISYEVIEQDTQRQIIEVVKKVDIPHSYSIYKSRYKVVNNNITPISFKTYVESIGAMGNMMFTFLIAIFIYFISKLLLYLLFTKNENTKLENIETDNISKYYWKGVIDGENQEGEILAQSKEDATNRLKDKKVIITQLKLVDNQKQGDKKAELFVERAVNSKPVIILKFVLSWALIIIPPILLYLLLLSIENTDQEYYCSDTYCDMSGVLFMPVLFFSFILLIERLIRKVKNNEFPYKKLASPLLLFCISMFWLFGDYRGGMHEKIKLINNRLEIIATEIQFICEFKKKCPSSLDGLNFKRVKAGSFSTQKGLSDEISKDNFLIDGIGYYEKKWPAHSLKTYKKGITYKLKPWHGLIAFDYKINNDKFSLSYVADRDDMVTIEISGGANLELTFKESCILCVGRDDVVRYLK